MSAHADRQPGKVRVILSILFVIFVYYVCVPIFLMGLAPMMTIWSLNMLFNLNIGFGVYQWAAMTWLLAIWFIVARPRFQASIRVRGERTP